MSPTMTASSAPYAPRDIKISHIFREDVVVADCLGGIVASATPPASPGDLDGPIPEFFQGEGRKI